MPIKFDGHSRLLLLLLLGWVGWAVAVIVVLWLGWAGGHFLPAPPARTSSMQGSPALPVGCGRCSCIVRFAMGFVPCGSGIERTGGVPSIPFVEQILSCQLACLLPDR